MDNQNTKPSIVDILLGKRQSQDTAWTPSPAQKERMIKEEPSDGQMRKLLRYGLSHDDIAKLNRWDASELIEKEEARRSSPGSLSPRQETALINCGYLPDDLKALSFYEASELMERTFAGRPRKR